MYLPAGSTKAIPPVRKQRKVYSFAWNTAGNLNGDYLAVVSYAADGNTFNDQFVEKIHLGDTYVTGPIALDATVAHITDLLPTRRTRFWKRGSERSGSKQGRKSTPGLNRSS
jgi:hypothetical protein